MYVTVSVQMRMDAVSASMKQTEIHSGLPSVTQHGSAAKIYIQQIQRTIKTIKTTAIKLKHPAYWVNRMQVQPTLPPIISVLVIVSAFIAETGSLFPGLVFAGTAPVAEFLLVAGSTETVAAGAAVILRSAGVGISAVIIFLLLHEYHAPFVPLL